MKGYSIVTSDELKDKTLVEWIAMTSQFVGPMPPKKPAAKKK